MVPFLALIAEYFYKGNSLAPRGSCAPIVENVIILHVVHLKKLI
jgi:hypothetical protein